MVLGRPEYFLCTWVKGGPDGRWNFRVAQGRFCFCHVGLSPASYLIWKLPALRRWRPAGQGTTVMQEYGMSIRRRMAEAWLASKSLLASKSFSLHPFFWNLAQRTPHPILYAWGLPGRLVQPMGLPQSCGVISDGVAFWAKDDLPSFFHSVILIPSPQQSIFLGSRAVFLFWRGPWTRRSWGWEDAEVLGKEGYTRCLKKPLGILHAPQPQLRLRT